MLGLSLTPAAPRGALLARDRARSDDPETDDGPDPVGGHRRAEPPIHPFTGKFADPEHTVAYRSQAFRMMTVMSLALFEHRRDGTHDTRRGPGGVYYS